MGDQQVSDNAPHAGILDRHLTLVEVKPIVEEICSLLREVINYGTHVLVRCNASKSGAPDEDHATFAIYRHILEMSDGIEILVASCAPASALPLLRSQYEAWVSIKYIIGEPEQYSRRCLSWLVTHWTRRLAAYERFIPGSSSYEAFLESLRKDKYARDIALPAEAQARQAADNVSALLAKPHMAPYKAEYDRVRGKRPHPPKWFELFEGPRTLAQLARKVGLAAVHSELYGHWSMVSHVTEFSGYLTPLPDGGSAIRPLRRPQANLEVGTMAISTLCESSQIMLLRHRQGEEESFRNWYVTRIRKRFQALMQITIVDPSPL